MLTNQHLTRTRYKSGVMLHFLLEASLFLLIIQKQVCQDVVLQGPQNVKVDYNLSEQRISVTWEDDLFSPRGPDKLIYDVEVLLTDSMKYVHREAVGVTSDQVYSKHHWSWTSVLPLECASHSVRLRSRYQTYTSQWSPLQTNTGMKSSYPEVYPKNRVVQVDSNFTFCCILGPGQSLKFMHYNNTPMKTINIGEQSYAMVVHMSTPSPPNCINVNCNSAFYGTCVYVGYPPDDRNLVCETRDLESVVCHWDKGRLTCLTKKRQTQYHLNGRACPHDTVSNCKQTVRVDQGEKNWTLTAENPLGTLELIDRADLKKRVHLLAPVELEALNVNARNASVQWRWEINQYTNLLMICEVQLENNGQIDVRKYSGNGIGSVVLTDLAPAQTYTVQVRCGLKQHFWKWGDWSRGSTFETKEDIPEMLDVWMQIEGNQTVVLWKPLTANQSHGHILDYEVTWGRQNATVIPTRHYFPLSDQFTSERHRVTVTARNSAGTSPPTAITIPRLPKRMRSAENVVGSDGAFDLVWSASPDARCGYVVDWCPTYKECRPEWLKVPTGITRARVQSVSFEECVRYTFSIYGCTPGAPELLERREGYVKECLPEVQIKDLDVKQYGSDTVQISWTGIPLENQTSFLHSYVIYYFNSLDPASVKTVHVSPDEPKAKNLTGLTSGSYTFTLKALTSVGEGGESSPYQKKIDPPIDQLITVMVICLGSFACLLTLVTVVCYRNWNWIRSKLYPKIPKPAWNDKWLTERDDHGCQILYVDRCHPNKIDTVGDQQQAGEVELENDARNKDSVLRCTDSYIPAPHGNHILYPPGHSTSAPCVMSFQHSRTDVTNYSYNLVIQAALDMGQPSIDSPYCLNPEPLNDMSHVPPGCDLSIYQPHVT